jgi:hypothetical protein
VTAELRALVGQGDIAGLRAALIGWRDRLPDHTPVLDQLLAWVGDYQLERVESFLASRR